MVIYIEYLFMENVLVGAAILKISSKLGKLKTNKLRIGLGSLLCGFFAFIIFVDNLGVFFGNFLKLSFSVLLAVIAFKANYIKGTLLIYLTSTFMGGMTIVLMYMSKLRGIANNAVLYIGETTYVNVIVGILVSILILNSVVKVLQEGVLKERILVDVLLRIEGHEIKERALIDSGNFLKDPILGRPVAVMSKSEAKVLKSYDDVDWERRFCLIPYNSVGKTSGLLEGYRVDEAIINGQNIGSIVVAVYDAEFCSFDKEEHYQMLLNKDCLLGGVA